MVAADNLPYDIYIRWCSMRRNIFTMVILWFVLLKVVVSAVVIPEWLGKVYDSMPEHVPDMNADGLYNCIDYSLCFKVTWDSMNSARDCEIVYNSILNHLFIRVRKDINSAWIYVEPQGSRYRYTMQDVWGDKYIAGGNVYGGTAKWLNDMRR